MAVLYSSRMESLGFFDTLTGYIYVIPGWGIDGLNAVTCSKGSTSHRALADLTSELHEGTIRWQYGYLYVSGEDYERDIASFNCNDAAEGAGSNRSFLSALLLNPDGSITFYRANGPADESLIIGTSAPGVFIRDGSIHALQFRFSFPAFNEIHYEFLINDVSVLSGIHTTTQSFTCMAGSVGSAGDLTFYPEETKHYWLRFNNTTDPYLSGPVCHLQVERTGINFVAFKHYAKIGTGAFTDHISSLVEVIIDDADDPVSYVPNNAVPIAMAACSGAPPTLPPFVPPSSTTETRLIRRLRCAPHLTQENTRVFYHRFELDLERGVGLPSGPGADPLVQLRCSRDGGQTWGAPLTLHAGALGAYTQRVLAWRLGYARDMVFEVTVTDPVAWSLVGAWLDLAPGTS